MRLALGTDDFVLRRREDEKGVLMVLAGHNPATIAHEKLNRWKAYERGEL